MAKARIVTDLTAQCETMGDLCVAIEAGAVTRANVAAELGELVLGVKCGRTNAQDIVIFDSTGVGAQDAFAAAAVFDNARKMRRGAPIRLAG